MDNQITRDQWDAAYDDFRCDFYSGLECDSVVILTDEQLAVHINTTYPASKHPNNAWLADQALLGNDAEIPWEPTGGDEIDHP